MTGRARGYERLGCWGADGEILPMVSMDFRVGEAEAKAIVMAALIAPEMPAGTSVVLRRLLDATTRHFEVPGFKRGAADAEVDADHFAVWAGAKVSGRQPIAPLAAFFGIEWREGDEEWWQRHLPPGWELVGHRGREQAQLKDPSGRLVGADGGLVGGLLAHGTRTGWLDAGELARSLGLAEPHRYPAVGCADGGTFDFEVGAELAGRIWGVHPEPRLFRSALGVARESGGRRWYTRGDVEVGPEGFRVIAHGTRTGWLDAGELAGRPAGLAGKSKT